MKRKYGNMPASIYNPLVPTLRDRLRHPKIRFSRWARRKVLDWLMLDDMLWELDHAQVRFEIDMQDEFDSFRREIEQEVRDERAAASN